MWIPLLSWVMKYCDRNDLAHWKDPDHMVSKEERFHQDQLFAIQHCLDTSPGPSCSKLTMSLVNDLLKFTSSDMQICWNFLLKKNVSAKATHIFSAKNIRILYIEYSKTVNVMTLNKLVKLTTLWTTGPRQLKCLNSRISTVNDYGIWIFKVIKGLFVLRLYSPVNPNGSCWVQSVYLTSLPNHTFTGQA